MRHLNQQPEPSPAIQYMYEWGASANKQVRAVPVEKTQARDPQVVDDQVEQPWGVGHAMNPLDKQTIPTGQSIQPPSGPQHPQVPN
jgi:hypothetical protein